MSRPKFIRLLSAPRFTLAVWGVLLVLACLRVFHGSDAINNYLIFERSWDHLISGTDLYAYYPEEYHDHFLYGPLFAVLIAPLSLLPTWPGMWLWLTCGMGLMLLAVYALRDRLSGTRTAVFMWIVANEVYLALLMQQYNLYVAALLLLAFVCVEKDLPGLFALIVVVGLLTKIYGAMGILLFPFLNRKKEAVILGLTFFVVLILLPALLTKGGWTYLESQYRSWFETLVSKNGDNLYAGQQNLGLLGMVRKTLGLPPSFSDLYLMIPGGILLLLPLVRRAQYGSVAFRSLYLSSIALFTVLFCTGTESNTYIIGYIGIALWFAAYRTGGSLAEQILFWGALFFSFSTSDLLPHALRYDIIQPYALKALFPSLIWFYLIYRLLTHDFGSDTAGVQTPSRVGGVRRDAHYAA